MKTIKFLLVSLCMMLGLAVQAQQVVITKTDGTVEVFQPGEVDSVVYKPAAKYYYYAGWELPANEDELKSKGTLIGTTLNNYTLQNPLVNYLTNSITHDAKENYYVIIPEKYSIHDATGTDVVSSAFTNAEVSITGYKAYKSNVGSRQINSIIIY